MRRIKKGDVFKAKLENGEIRYFQYIGKDSSELDGDVICIFKTHYAEEAGNQENKILDDEIESYIHTSVSLGVKWELWEYAFSALPKSEKGIYFRTSMDILNSGHPDNIVSHDWVVWEMNKRRKSVGILPKKYHHVDIGGVYAPTHVMELLETGLHPDRGYPTY